MEIKFTSGFCCLSSFKNMVLLNIQIIFCLDDHSFFGVLVRARNLYELKECNYYYSVN